jgi:D-alanyl-D-alanine dipeptidase
VYSDIPMQLILMIPTTRFRRRASVVALLVVAPFVPLHAQRGGVRGDSARDGAVINDPARLKPKPPPPSIAALVGEYGTGKDTILVGERNGALFAIEGAHEIPLTAAMFGARGSARAPTLRLGARRLPRRAVGTEEGVTFRIVVRTPIDDLRRAALAASPPAEPGVYRAGDLVELVTLDPSIKLDIRYASTNNFMGAAMYSSARAFMQRPAAEAIVRAHQALAANGYGILIHDAYRPWYITKMFWDATRGPDREFVANPASGSKHNRGAAVDLTLFDRATGKAVRMTGGYDEFSHRSYADYPGGTALERWQRDLLRRALDAQGFTVNPTEWWHFDFQGWREYPILNIAFEGLGR